jgi:apolipoprotein D and lipocalin family protein
VLYTDYDTVAVIGSPDHEYLWILARSKDLEHNILEKAILVAKDQNFDTTKLILIIKESDH